MYKLIVCSCLSIWATAFCLAQPVVFKGRVLNEQNAGIAHVNVTASQNNFVKLFTQSDTDGYFSLLVMQGQKYVLQLSSVGYKKIVSEITVTSSLITTIYTLNKNQTDIDTVKVVSKKGYYESGDTLFFNTDVYKRNNENNLKDLLNNLPGVRVLPSGKISVDGQIVEKLLVDGKDLTGDEYEKIVNNLSPHGLDQIQVLRKYRDPFSLSASITGDTEVAINLTFKKKKIIPNGKISVGLGLPLTHYENKADFLITHKYLTGLCFANWNTIGYIFPLISSPGDILGMYKPNLFTRLGAPLPYFNGVSEIWLPLTKNLYSFNNSRYVDNSSQIKFSQKITDKFTITYSPEKIEQTYNSLSKTYVGNQVFAETKSINRPVINSKKFIVKNELIWMIGKGKQVKLESNYKSENNTGTNEGILNNKTLLQNTVNNRNIFTNLLNYSAYLKKSRLFNAAIYYETESTNESLFGEGIAYEGTLFSSIFGTVRDLNQRSFASAQSFGCYLKLIKHKNDFSVTIQPTFKSVFGDFYSNLSVLTSLGNVFDSIDSFYNKFNYTQKVLSIPTRYQYSDLKNKINLSIEVEPLLFIKQKFHSFIKENHFNFNSSASLRYSLKNKKSLSLFASRRYEVGTLAHTLQNKIIIDNKNIQAPSSSITNSASYSLFVNFQNSTFNKKSKNSYQFRYSRNEPSYLRNSINNNQYSLFNYFPYNPNNFSLGGSVKNEISLQRLKIRIEQSLDLGIGKSYHSQNNILLYTSYRNIGYSFRAKSKFPGAINFDWNNNFSYRTNINSKFAVPYKNYSNTSTALIDYSYMKKMNFTLSFQDYYFLTPLNNQKNHLLFANISYKQLIFNKKGRIGFDVNNVFNNKRFGNQIASATNYYESYTVLLPFYFLARFEILL